ncbi:MAG TPA: response regulator [Tenuifilum sp.]|uniref:response regulator n=1 Tax=Tenuifilum sp. TaxID=2760880 RepID=UPI002CC51381|nr:response regulator [Tenuifilum sp.]HOK85166.1 response regulator [Tenuifilum sp.]HON71121.1 response regulator [Tenuifilum sp.]HOU73520.1 response regulator [Tenuifilum sp.]HPP89829.1 response regulator [Tenuifilum sp.]
MDFKGYVLVIDDSVTNQVLVEALLGEEGIRVVTVSNAADAYRLIDKEPPSLILLDLLMPNVTGIDFLKTIKQSERVNTIPVFIVTAANTELYRNQCEVLGVQEFFPKPVDIPLLVKRVKEVLAGV